MKYSILFTMLLLASNSFAGILGNSFFIETSVGLRTENITFTDLTNTDSTFKSNAPSVGLKLGFRSLLGIDFNLTGDYSAGSAEVTNRTDKQKFNHQSMGAQVGVNSFGVVKMYLGTTTSNSLTVEDSLTADKTILSGPSYHAGVILKFFPVVNVGLQYNLNQYKNIENPNLTSGTSIDTYFNKIDSTDYTVYLSLPL